MRTRISAVAVLAAVLMFPGAAVAQPYGPIGTLGPAGATVRTCTGVPSCTVVNPSGAWQAAIEGAASGATVLMDAGTYTPSGTLDLPSGITVANHAGAAVTINAALPSWGNGILLEGVTVSALSSQFAVVIQSSTSTVKSNIELKNVSIRGGTGDGVRIKGNTADITIRNSLIDGGQNNHGLLVECNADLPPCTFTPERTLITNNRFSKTVFAGASTEDLLQIEGQGDTTITHNSFGQNATGEQCVDFKRSGRSGATAVLAFNDIDGRSGSGCQAGPLLITQPEAGTLRVEGNHFFGGSSLFRATPIGAIVANNLFEGGGAAEVTVASTQSRMTLGYNTFFGTGNGLTFGDSTGVPNALVVTNNIFAGTIFRGTSTWGNERSFNLLFGTSGSSLGSCPTCITGQDPLLSGYDLQEGSPAIDAAGPFTVAADIEGTARPQGPGFDIGAFEFVSDGEPPPPDPQQPFADNLIPGIVDAEDYDLGGEGVAYHDATPGNEFGMYRTDDVDIKTVPGGFAVGLMETGEWLEYTVDVQADGDYAILANVANGDADLTPRFTVSVDGLPVATVMPPFTGDWDTQQLIGVGETTLTAGEHLVRIDIDAQWVDIDYLDFQPGVLPPEDDLIAPDVEITAPLDGATVPRKRDVTVTWFTEDDPEGDGVETSVLTIDGTVRATRSGEGTFSFVWRTPASRNEHTLSVTATDFAGNVATDAITVTTR